jgi:hypothetical protein
MIRLYYLIALLSILCSCSKGKNKETGENSRKAKTNIFVIVDVSGSAGNINMPKPNKVLLDTLYERIERRGLGGKIWLDYVDDNCLNNQPIYVMIDALPKKPKKPKLGAGQFEFSKTKEMTKYKKEQEKYKKDSLAYEARKHGVKQAFLTEVETLLDKLYNKKIPVNLDYSDCHCVLNFAFKAFKDLKGENENYILAFSDLEESLPLNRTSVKLEQVSKNTQTFRIGYRGNDNKNGLVTKELESVKRIEEEIE